MIGVGEISYTLSGVMYLVLTLLLLTSWKGRLKSGLLLAVTMISTIWGCVTAYDYFFQSVPEWLLFVIEAARNSSWLAFLLGLLTLHKVNSAQRYYAGLAWVVCAVVSLFGAGRSYYSELTFFFWGADPNLIFIMLFMTLIGLVLVEQLYRNRTTEASSSIGYLCMAVGAIFVYDIYVYSNAMLFSKLDEDIWAGRGALNAFVVPLIVLAARRNPDLSLRIFVSRQIVFYTTSLLGSGMYLLGVALAGYYIKLYGGDWGAVFQVLFLSGAVLMLAMVLSSPISRAKVRTFLSKHFYSNKYEYREHWMRLTGTLTEEADTEGFNRRVVFALTDILDARGGMLWLQNDMQSYTCISKLNMPYISDTEPGQSEFVRFLTQKKWIIDLDEHKKQPAVYDDLRLPGWLQTLDDAWLVIPLLHQGKLSGFVIISHSNVVQTINWEDRDLLKTAALQVSSYLALMTAKEELDRAHQFDAFNRLSAFVVHDLKNLVAQLGLVVKNAEKHRNNPAFMDDAITTVDNAVKKMDRLLTQLRKARFEQQPVNNISINKTISEAVSNMKDLLPIPEFVDSAAELHLVTDKDRFTAILEHLIRNAQEATANDGYVRITLREEIENAVIEVADNGSGMDEEFIRQRLFRPFYTTKGNAGMGIGVYEARQFVQQLGGTIQVSSKLDIGTTFRIQLPLGTA
ncbi:MAG: PEP-CTERM system histidine kinase PrsK [Gammaproteobacteria bacterium]|nr:PEP-CTERM system histidine kinase PrsK [Gammaproteobacteria bacterium]MDH5652392.1 PEP-CTERM system histidine kinase PrsK [Gammaproteobacteria bacterium]